MKPLKQALATGDTPIQIGDGDMNISGAAVAAFLAGFYAPKGKFEVVAALWEMLRATTDEEPSREEKARILSFPNGDMEDYDRVAKLIGYEGDWTDVVILQLGDVVSSAEVLGHGYGRQFTDVFGLTAEKSLDTDSGELGNAVEVAIAACYYAAADKGTLDELVGELEPWETWPIEEITRIAAKYPPTSEATTK